jgi:uncharacterized protein (TIGR00255 family)
MTGYSRVNQMIQDLDVVLSIKSVNHRGLDVHFYTGPALDPFEASLRSTIKKHVNRGHLDVRVQIGRATSSEAIQLDTKRLSAYLAVYRAAQEQFSVQSGPDLNAILRLPGMLAEGGEVELPPGFEAQLLDLLVNALELLNTFREREGAELAEFMKRRNTEIAEAAEQMAALRRKAIPVFQTRLRERLSELLGHLAIEPQRLLQEAAILADRSDVGEEISRLEIHSRQVDALLASSGEVGKKLDFLLQEMNREANTIVSKTSGIGEVGLGLTELALSAKANIEKIREQSLNLE